MAAKRCRESCDEEQGPPLRCSRDDHSFQTQQNTTENLLRLIQTVDEMKKNKSARLLKLINEVRSRSELPPEPFFDFEQLVNSQQIDEVPDSPPEPFFDFEHFVNSQQIYDASEPGLYPIFEPFVNSRQTGNGVGTQSRHTLDLTDPNMGLKHSEIESLVRQGGNVAGYTIVPRARFNGLEIHRIINLREISSTDLADYTVFLHDMFSEIVAFSRLLGGDSSLININLRGASLTSDVNTLLSANNDYSVDLFINDLEKIMQSNSDVQFDESLNLSVYSKK